MALPEIKAIVTADTRQAEKGLGRVSAAMDQFETRTQRATVRTAGLQRGIQNAAFQVGDFAVQVGAGARASQALAMQLPQLLGGFGVLGAVLGAVVAVGVPLVTVMRDMSDSGRDMTAIFGTLQPVAAAVGDAFSYVGSAMHDMAEIVVNNMDRILVIGGTVAAFYGVQWVASMALAAAASFSLSGALATLRAALLRTGFGVLIIAAGELVYQFTRLVEGAGGFMIALRMLPKIAGEVWERLQDGAWATYLRLESIAIDIQVAWQKAWAAILGNDVDTSFLEEMSANLRGQSDTLFDNVMKPLESVRSILKNMKDERITLSDILGGGEDKDGKTLKDKLSENEKAIAEHMERIRALTVGGLSDKLGAWGDYFNNLASLTGDSNTKLLRLGKAFAASQALIDAWTAHNRVLADPTLPWWARIASAGSVLAAGIGAVNAIKSVGSGGGGASGSTGGATTTQSQGPLEVRLQGVTADSLFTGASVSSLFDMLNAEAGDRGVRVIYA